MSAKNEPRLTSKQAYLTMFEFLRRHYERGASDEIGGLLGGLSLLADGSTADPAIWPDWEEASEVVRSSEQTPEGCRGADLRPG
jgi:hypothetical protein